MKRENLRELLARSPVKLPWLAKQLKITNNYLHLFVAGVRPLPERLLPRLALMLNQSRETVKAASDQSVRDYHRARSKSA